MHKIVAAAVVVLLSLVSVGCCKSKGSSSSSSSGASDPGPAETPTTVKISTLLSDYKNNEVRADGVYKGKLIQTSGSANDIKKDIMGGMYVTVGTGKSFEIPVVQCQLGENEAKKAANLNKGDKVTVRGRVTGLLMNVQVEDCEIM